MARRISPSQFRSMVRQAEQRQRQAINNYNAAVRRYNSGVRRAISEYNRQVAAHNARVRSNRQRLLAEIARLESRSRTRRFVTYEISVRSLHTFLSQASVQSWDASGDLLDLAQGEAANSVAVLNALEGDSPGEQDDGVGLQVDGIARELADFPLEVRQRWGGALYALNPRNPDAARHFCTSAREILTAILEKEAPDASVLAADPSAPLTPDGRPTRRSKIRYCLRRHGHAPSLSEFIDRDISNVVDLFQVFNDGTHGSAGHYTVGQLLAVKQRVEDAVRFLHATIRA